ncbi:terminase large subunit [Fictibacillus nanhaiensis]|uniref:terminase large subunit n=1 Tax=Fictibacillus nanhaiensis TaxID=742169 RepID=UPI00203AAF3B|nr:terminase TerL endonuclease subunit [Fictibacillus nanhaiensis]MCM3730062.1 terminase large subunit [Fictibacillus nanhaiensis]
MIENFWYDYEEEKKIIRFIEKLNLDKGKKGQKIKLLDFQKKILCDLLCWKNPDGTRKHREGFVFLPRKNGKSFLIACIFVYSLYCDDEYGAEYIIAANSRDQAGHLFDTVKNMIETNPTLRKYCRIVDSRKKIIRKATNSFLQVISSDASKADGYNGYIVCQDETHEAPNDELYSKLKTSMGTRMQPLMLTITTASNGTNEANLEYRTYLYAKKVQSGEVKDDTFYSAIYEAEDNCDLVDESQWYRSNPALGVFRNFDELKSLAYRAKEIPSEEAKFRRLYLNQHVRLSNEQAINPYKWELCGKNFDFEMLKGKKCWAGLDLATTTDIVAFVMVFPIDDKFYIVPHLFKPSGTLLDHEKLDRTPYSSWSKQNWNGIPLLHATEGDYVSFRYVRQIINECGKEYKIQEIAFDRLGSQGIVSDLTEDGFIVVDFGQGYRSMSPAIKHFEELMFDKKIQHGNHPIMNWMAGNVIATEDAAGNVKYDKGKAKYRIDGIIAMLMGVSRAFTNLQYGNLGENINDETLDELGW